MIGLPPEYDSDDEVLHAIAYFDRMEQAFADYFNTAYTEIASTGTRPQPCTCKGLETMKMSDAFPSKYLKAEDVEDEPVLTIVEMQVENVAAKGEREEKKCVLYFKEEEKGMVVNKTNWKTISEVLGSDDSDDWMGKKIQLFIGDATYKGETVDAIRVKRRAKRPERAAPPPERSERSDGQGRFTPAQARAARAAAEEYDGSTERDDIPF